MRCHDPTTWSTSDFVGDLVQVSNESGALRGANGWSRIGMGEKILGSAALNSVGEVGVRDPENADVGNGGESKRGRPAFPHKNFLCIWKNYVNIFDNCSLPLCLQNQNSSQQYEGAFTHNYSTNCACDCGCHVAALSTTNFNLVFIYTQGVVVVEEWILTLTYQSFYGCNLWSGDKQSMGSNAIFLSNSDCLLIPQNNSQVINLSMSKDVLFLF